MSSPSYFSATTNRLVLWAQTYNRALPMMAMTSAPTDADGMGCPRMGGKIVADVLLALMEADFLFAADLRDHLHAAEYRRGAIDKGRRTIEGIRRVTVDFDVGILHLKLGEQGQGEPLAWWGERVGRRLRRPLLLGDALLLEGLVLLIPCAQLGGGLIEAAHGDGDFGRDQHEKDQALSPDAAPAFFIVEFVEIG